MEPERVHVGALAGAVVVLLAVACVGCGDAPRSQPSTATPEARRATPTAEPTTAAPGARAGVAWTHDTLMRRLRGRRIRVAERTVPLLADSIACTGIGRPADSRGGERAWALFRCVQPTFPPGEVAGPDAIFIVEPTGPRRFVVSDQHFTEYAP